MCKFNKTLSVLKVQNNPVSDISCLKGMRLTGLELVNVPVTDISVVTTMPRLDSLSLISLRELRDFSPLYKLKGLRLLDISESMERLIDIEKIKENNPEGSIKVGSFRFNLSDYAIRRSLASGYKYPYNVMHVVFGPFVKVVGDVDDITDCVEKVIKTLPKDEREVSLAVYKDGSGSEEISAQYGISRTEAGRRFNMAVKKLRHVSRSRMLEKFILDNDEVD